MKKWLVLIIALFVVGCATTAKYNSETEEVEALVADLEKMQRSSFHSARVLIKMGYNEKTVLFLTRNLGSSDPDHRSFGARYLIFLDKIPPATLKALEYVAANDVNRKVRNAARQSLQKFKIKEFETDLGNSP